MRLKHYNGRDRLEYNPLLRIGLISLPFVEWHQKTTSNKVSDNQNINGPMVWLCLAENSLNTCSILHFPVWQQWEVVLAQVRWKFKWERSMSNITIPQWSFTVVLLTCTTCLVWLFNTLNFQDNLSFICNSSV